jgi:asparagine synthase (glutamine-hydrolysing)
MCGILGSINYSFNQSNLDLIKHRGPDDFGLNSFTINNNEVILSQRRLAILDLSPAGHQPMISSCENFSIIFNGEIYNHLELREKLPKNIQYNGHSDTETILYYIIHFGIDSMKDFNGIFAFAFINITKKELFLARDPFGVKPLYYYEQDNQLIFSSEIRPIKSLLPETNLSKDNLASLLRLRFNASPNTLYTTIKKIKPGHYQKYNLEEKCFRENETYYIQNNKNKEIDKPSKLLGLYGSHLENAVKRQLLADVEVGILLSGGIDSAVVAALAKKHYKGKLKAFTIGFEGENAEDEIEDAKHTAEILDLDHYVKRINFDDFIGLIKKCSSIVEEPLATTSMIPMFYLSELASKHVKVVLTGQGADEPLGGYGRYKMELYRQFIPPVFHSLINPLVKLLNIQNEQILRGAKSITIKNEIKRFLSVYEIFSQDEIKSLINQIDNESEKHISVISDLINLSNEKHTVEKMMAIDTRLNLADDLLIYTDKITMNFSLECRVPMLDIELVNFIESLPLKSKLNRNGGKIIHKEFAKSILPEEIINRPKKGFQSPTNKWFKLEMNQIKNTLLNPDSTFKNYFNLNSVENILNQHLNGFNKEKQIFLFLSLYFWLESTQIIELKNEL